MLTVAIDGPAAAGKSTVGRGVAHRLHCWYLDTGLMYRAVTYLALLQSRSVSDGPALARIASGIHFSLCGVEDDGIKVNGLRMKDELRSAEVDRSVSAVSAHPEVRQILVRRQRELARNHPIVMVGRDIGTVVLPDADIKLWVTASPRTRALRRYHEHLVDHAGRDEEGELQRLIRRDELDSTRAVSPLRQADDAIVLETDSMDVADVVERAVAMIRERCGALLPEPTA